LVAAAIFLKLQGPIAANMGEKYQYADSVLYKLLLLIAAIVFVMQSVVYIDEDSVGIKNRIYGSALPPGHIVAVDGQKGPQAEILGPGFNFSAFINVIYDIDTAPVVNIPEGKVGILVAKDGLPMPDSTYMAPPWDESEVSKMLNAEYFLGKGKGIKGPQVTVLKPAKYRINPYLFDVKLGNSLDVPAGYVAVIRSTVSSRKDCKQTHQSGVTDGKVGTTLVERGCQGVWKDVLSPSKYYLNPSAYQAIIIPTRVQKWLYKGGYKRRKIDLKLGDDGKITQTESVEDVYPDPNSASTAITVRVEGWTFPVEVRVVVQVNPQDAPLVVESVGSLQEVEDRIVTPAIRDSLRSIAGSPDRKVLDFITKRQEISSMIEKSIAVEARKAGVTVQEVKLGDTVLPPELMVSRLRKQLATQLAETYKTERDAQKERVKTERERATADQQPTLVKAEIGRQAAEYTKQKLKLQGEGEKLRLMEVAKGQKAQTAVLGERNTVSLQIIKEVLAAVSANPELVKYPNVLVNGSGSGDLTGAAAILGHSNVSSVLNSTLPSNKKVK